MNIKTASLNTTQYISLASWKGKDVQFTGDMPCDSHMLEVMHHVGDNGEHYCPTGYIFCVLCGAIGAEPEPYTCNRWGK